MKKGLDLQQQQWDKRNPKKRISERASERDRKRKEKTVRKVEKWRTKKNQHTNL